MSRCWLALVCLVACKSDAPLNYCGVDRAPSVDHGGTSTEAVTLRFVFMRPHQTGVLVEERVRWTEPVDSEECGLVCQDQSSTDVYELRWSRRAGGFEWETPGPGPNEWDCTSVNDDRDLDCDVTHRDGTREMVAFHESAFGRGGPPTGLRDERCVQLDVQVLE